MWIFQTHNKLYNNDITVTILMYYFRFLYEMVYYVCDTFLFPK